MCTFKWDRPGARIKKTWRKTCLIQSSTDSGRSSSTPQSRSHDSSATTHRERHLAFEVIFIKMAIAAQSNLQPDGSPPIAVGRPRKWFFDFRRKTKILDEIHGITRPCCSWTCLHYMWPCTASWMCQLNRGLSCTCTVQWYMSGPQESLCVSLFMKNHGIPRNFVPIFRKIPLNFR